jgi:hypothetical protein
VRVSNERVGHRRLGAENLIQTMQQDFARALPVATMVNGVVPPLPSVRAPTAVAPAAPDQVLSAWL